MNFLKNLFGILGTLISVWGLFVILDALGSRSEGAWVDPAGFRVVFGYIILIPGLIMLGLWWLIGKFVSKPNDVPIKNEIEHEQALDSAEKEQRRAESLGVEIAICPNCGTLNSLSLLTCEKCKTNLEKVKPVRNPHI
jgi:hypothetical protein